MSAVISNPIVWADVPDPCVIRVGSAFYMVSTSMHSMPGCPILKSVNLRDWELIGYVYDTLEDNEAHRLQDGRGIYGKGSWAACLRQHGGWFHVCFSSNDMDRFYMYRTRDIERGPWERHVMPGLLHDPSLLFDDGRVYVIHGNGDIRITELTADATARLPGGVDRLLLATETEGIGLRCEGCHAFQRNGFYYLFFIEWPRTGNRRRRQLVYRSQRLLGPYERRELLDDDLGYRNNGVAQGGIVDDGLGGWHAVLFQDHGAVGRVPCVVPVTWEDDWPVFGVDAKAPLSYATGLPASAPQPLAASDEFDYGSDRLGLFWQWNHNPDPRLWSVTERPGYLRLRTGMLASSVEYARNTLTQRTEGPACSASVLLDAAGLLPGDRAGLAALSSQFGLIGLRAEADGKRSVVMAVKGEDGGELVRESRPYAKDCIFLRLDCRFEEGEDIAEFFYSEDGAAWERLGPPLEMAYTLHHFMGYRFGLFCYATEHAGGFADLDYFRYRKVSGRTAADG